MHGDVIRLQSIAAQAIAVGTIIAWRKERKGSAVVIFRIEENRLVAIRNLVARNGIVVAVRRNDAVIAHVRNRIVLDFRVVRKSQPDAVRAAAHGIVVDAVPRAKSQFDGIIQHIGNVIAADGIIVAARQRVRLDKNAVPIPSGNFIIGDDIAAGTILHDNAASITSPANCSRAPGAFAHVIDSAIAGCLAIIRSQEINAPRRIIRCGIAFDGYAARIPHVDADGLVQSGIVQHLGIGHVVQSNSAAFGHSQEFAKAGRRIGIVIIIRAVIIANDQMVAGFNPNAGVEIA